MNSTFPLICYTQDEALLQRLSACAEGLSEVRPVAASQEMEPAIEPLDPAAVVFDLRAERAADLLGRVLQSFPETVVVALGMPRSDPWLAAERLGVFAVEDSEAPESRLRALVRQASAHALALHEKRVLLQRLSAASPAVSPAATPVQDSGLGRSFRALAGLLRHIDQFQTLLDSLADNIAEAAKVSRVGLFVSPRSHDAYRLRAGVHCLPETAALVIPSEAPLVRWLRRRMHLVARTTLPLIPDPADHLLLKQTLDQLGAEVLLPLPGRNRLLGWMFLGHRVAGVPFTPEDLEDLGPLAHHVGLAIENALLYDEITVQKVLAETVIQCMPIGIVTVDSDGVVSALNASAAALFHVERDQALGRPVSTFDSRLGDLLARCLEEPGCLPSAEWTTAGEGRILSVVARRLDYEGQRLGAVAILRDLTAERELRKRQEEAERASFWAELAAAISHEVRNPLVAISTFAQLLPERHQDAEFRHQFSDLVHREIGRLIRMVEQINLFANPPELRFESLELRPLLDEAWSLARHQAPAERVRAEFSIPGELPRVRGDRTSLITAFSHLFVNALEAMDKTPTPALSVDASLSESDGRVRVRIRDQGCGIPDDIFEHVFSPFASTKARGIGLGLPIARRTMTDHGGDLRIERAQPGTLVTVTIPVATGPADANRGKGPTPAPTVPDAAPSGSTP